MPDSGAGRFGLRLQQHLPLNAYLNLQVLQRALDQRDRVNALLIAAPNSQHQDLQRALAQHLTLADLKLDLALHSNYIELTSTRFVLDDPTRAAALASATSQQFKTATFSTYLANAIESQRSPNPLLNRYRSRRSYRPLSRRRTARANPRAPTPSTSTLGQPKNWPQLPETRSP